MTPRRRARSGDGTAWLVVDSVSGDYLCYWYAGPGGGELMEHVRVRERFGRGGLGSPPHIARPDPHP